MQKTFEAVYENGVLRPLEALRLPNNVRVTVTIGDLAATGQDLAGYFSPEEWEAAAHDEISLEESGGTLTVPTREPASLGLLAMGASGLPIWRRKEQLPKAQ